MTKFIIMAVNTVLYGKITVGMTIRTFKINMFFTQCQPGRRVFECADFRCIAVMAGTACGAEVKQSRFSRRLFSHIMTVLTTSARMAGSALPVHPRVSFVIKGHNASHIIGLEYVSVLSFDFFIRQAALVSIPSGYSVTVLAGILMSPVQMAAHAVQMVDSLEGRHSHVLSYRR